MQTLAINQLYFCYPGLSNHSTKDSPCSLHMVAMVWRACFCCSTSSLRYFRLSSSNCRSSWSSATVKHNKILYVFPLLLYRTLNVRGASLTLAFTLFHFVNNCCSCIFNMLLPAESTIGNKRATRLIRNGALFEIIILENSYPQRSLALHFERCWFIIHTAFLHVIWYIKCKSGLGKDLKAVLLASREFGAIILVLYFLDDLRR